MKNKCENFILLLLEDPETGIDEGAKKHLETCESCSRLLESHNRGFESLKNKLILAPQKKQLILAKIHQAIAADKAPESNSLLSTFWNWICIHRMQLALPLLFLVFGIVFLSQKQSDCSIQISGPAIILRNLEKKILDQNLVQLAFGEKVLLLEGRLNLFWNKLETVAINGNLDFTASDMSMAAISGKATLAFTPSARGYIVETKRSFLKIVGTIVRLELTEESDAVFVDKGKIEWSLRDKTKKGEAGAGTRILIRTDSNGSQIVEESLFSPVNSMSGVHFIKSGNDWVPQQVEQPGNDKK